MMNRPTHAAHAAFAPIPRRAGLLAVTVALAACGSLPLPEKPTRPTVYDLGPTAPLAQASPTGFAITLPDVDAPQALAQLPVQYRLAYSQAQSPMPYAQAAWSMPPAQLVHQRLSTVLGERHPILRVGDGVARLELRLQLVAFSQVFTAPAQSHGLVRLRATALLPQARGERLLQQRVFEAQAPAPSPDAPGGVQAMSTATDTIAQQMAQWLDTLPLPPAAPQAGKPAGSAR